MKTDVEIARARQSDEEEERGFLLFPFFFFSPVFCSPFFFVFFSREKKHKKNLSLISRKSLQFPHSRLLLLPTAPHFTLSTFFCTQKEGELIHTFFTRTSIFNNKTCCRLRRAAFSRRAPSRLVPLLLADLEAMVHLLLLLLRKTPRVVFFIGRECVPVPRARRRHLHLHRRLASGSARSRKTTI